MKIIDLHQNTPKWLEYRKHKLGASCAPIIMEVSPWSSPLMLYKEMLGLTTRPETNQYQCHGCQRKTDTYLHSRSSSLQQS